MTVRLRSFSSASSYSGHTGDAYSRSANSHSRSHSHSRGDAAEAATHATEASWREQAHWSSFRDAVHRIQGQLATVSEAGPSTGSTAGADGRCLKTRSIRCAQQNFDGRGRPPIKARGLVAAPNAVPSPSRRHPMLHQSVDDALRSPSPLEIERDLRLYRQDVEDSADKYLSNYPSPSREAASYTRTKRSHRIGSSISEEFAEEHNSKEEQQSEDSLDGLVQSLLPGQTGGCADPPTAQTTFPSRVNCGTSIDVEGDLIPDCIPRSVDPRQRTVVEPSPLRPHDIEEEEGVEEEEEEEEEHNSKEEDGIESSPVLVSRSDVVGSVKSSRIREYNHIPRAPIRSSSPHPSIASGSTSRNSQSTGTSSSYSSYGSSFDPDHLEEETRKRALESHLAETQLKLALVEAERDEMEFQLLNSRKNTK